MATFQITGPDGKRYRVTGDTPEGAMQALRQMVDTARPAQQHPEFDPANVPGGVPGYDPKTGMVGANGAGRTGAFLSGAVEGLPVVGPTFQKGVENAAAGIGSALSGQPFADVRQEIGGRVDDAQQAHPGFTTAGNVTGGVLGSGALVASAPAAFGVAPGMTMGSQMLRGGLSSSALSGADVAARGGDLTDVATGAGVGGVFGTLATPLVMGVQHLGRMAGGAFGVGNRGRAQQALADALTRSGRSADDVVADITQAGVDGQGGYALADALGNSGQRMLAGVARSPGDMRQTITETLQRRQMGQGDRLSNALAEGFNAPETAAQRTAGLKAQRTALADVNYANARSSAGAVNLNGALRQIDDLLGRDPILGETALSRGPMGARLQALRDQMQSGGEQLVDFNRVLNIKSDMYQQMLRNPDVASDLRPVYNMLDGALERASPQYRAANDAYRAQSRTIDAVDAGKAAESGRTRAADNIQTFRNMQPGEQNAFRAGYVDPLIAKVESSSISPTTNKARPLISEKTGQEFPAFAIPQRADRMGRRIAREQRMFETANAALGGSKTADNLSDIADVASFDPTMIGNLMSGNWGAAATAAIGKSANALQGRNQATRDMIADALLRTAPTRANEALSSAVRHGERLDARQLSAIRAMLTGAVPLANVPSALQ